MKVLGIDVGIAITGLGVVEKKGQNLTYIIHDTITTSKLDSQSERLQILYTELKKFIELHKPDVAGVEQLFFFRNNTTIIPVGQARGVILLALQECNIPIVEITPLQVKQFISMYGRAQKKDVQNMVKFLLKLDFIPKPDDAADALAIAMCSSTYNLKLLK